MTELADDAFDKKDARPPNMIGQYAGFFSRFLAFITDAVIISVIIVTIPAIINSIFRSLGLGPVINTSTILQKLGQIFGPTVIAIVFLICLTIYYLFFWFFTGQTPGKSLFGVRVLRTNGQRLGLWRGFLRLIGYIISIIPLGLGLLWVLGDDRRQGWHDKMADTFVIYAWEARPNERFLSDSSRNWMSTRLKAQTELSPEDYLPPTQEPSNPKTTSHNP
jgi:uncharacterized RDD family membrane protein YckC